MTAPLSVDHADGLDVITIDRLDKANALSRRVLEMVLDAVGNPSPDAFGIVIRSSGSIFSGGVDLGDAMGGADSGEADSVQSLLSDVVAGIEQCPLPVAVLVHGACVGGAVELMLACDLRVATPAATFWIPATQIGVVYRAHGVANLSRRLSPSTVRQLLLLGMKLDATAARKAGIVDMIIDEAKLLDRVSNILSRQTRDRATFAAQKSVLRLFAEHTSVPAAGLALMAEVRTHHDQCRRDVRVTPSERNST